MQNGHERGGEKHHRGVQRDMEEKSIEGFVLVKMDSQSDHV